MTLRTPNDSKLESESFVKWNSFSRVAVTRRGYIIIDADATTWIAGYDFDNLAPRNRHDLLTAGPGLPYVLRPGAKTLIIGPGGGMDVARCLASGSKDVTGVEINPIIATTIMREKFLDRSQGIYLRPEVHIVVEDGRSFVRRSHEKYQVLQATMVDTWASTAAGAFALAENNLYTVDAFRDYLGHLTDDGLIAFTRWTFNPPRESLRLVSLAMEALTQMGEPEPWRNVIVARQGRTDTVLISRRPFSEADLARARSALAVPDISAVYLPGVVGHGRGFEFAELLRSPDAFAYERSYPFDINPVTDNRPFFFYTVQPRDIWSFLSTGPREAIDFKVNSAVPLLFELMGISVVATLVILLLPPIVLGTRLPRQKGLLVFLLYFLFIGAGYILIEVALIQKFVLFLGHPTYALTVVIFSMLISSGLGSYFSRRVLNQSEARWMKALGAIAFLVALLGITRLVCVAHGSRTAALAEDCTYGPDDLSGWICHGDAFPYRAEALAGVAQAVGPVGVGAQCRIQRVGLGRSLGVRHLPRIDTDTVHRRPTLRGGAANCPAPEEPGTRGTGLCASSSCCRTGLRLIIIRLQVLRPSTARVCDTPPPRLASTAQLRDARRQWRL